VILQRMLSVRQVRNTALIEIRVSSRDSNEAAEIASAIAESYRAVRGEQRVEIVDRAWALRLLDRAFEAMLADNVDPAARREFELLKPWLTGQPADHTQADAARALCLNEGALRVRIHRLRRRFRDLVKAEIAQTVRDPAEVGDELRHLIAVLT
jgi:hypothetical protein